MRRVLPVVALLSTLISLFGCQPQEAPVPLRQRPREYRRVVSLSPGVTEILISTFQVNPVGRTAADNYPPHNLEKIPVVATVKPDYEKLREVQPDLIVLDGTLFSDQDIEKLKQTKATIFILKPKDIDDFRLQLFDLGNVVGTGTKAQDYVTRIRTEIANAKGAVAGDHRKVMVLMPGGNGSYMAAGTESFVADEVRGAGGDPVGPKADRFVPITPEAIAEANPDAIIVPAQDGKDASGALTVLKDARLKNTPAVKENRVGAVLGDVILRTGARVDTAIKALYQTIYSK